MIYRVKLDSGYREFYFDFRDAESACEFMTKAAESYNKCDSDKLEISLQVFTFEEYNSRNKEEGE
jgi:hypothetical protein